MLSTGDTNIRKQRGGCSENCERFHPHTGSARTNYWTCSSVAYTDENSLFELHHVANKPNFRNVRNFFVETYCSTATIHRSTLCLNLSLSESKEVQQLLLTNSRLSPIIIRHIPLTWQLPLTSQSHFCTRNLKKQLQNRYSYVDPVPLCAVWGVKAGANCRQASLRRRRRRRRRRRCRRRRCF